MSKDFASLTRALPFDGAIAQDAFAHTLLSWSDDDGPALLYEDDVWSYAQLVDEGCHRAGLLRELVDPERPPHVGVLLDSHARSVGSVHGGPLP